MPLNSSRGQCGSRIKRRSWKGEISRRETERGGEQLAGADTAVSDLSPTPAGKQTGSLCDLWSASPAGRPLLRLKEAGERERTSSSSPCFSFSQVWRTFFCLVLFCQFGISEQFCDSAELNATARTSCKSPAASTDGVWHQETHLCVSSLETLWSD